MKALLVLIFMCSILKINAQEIKDSTVIYFHFDKAYLTAEAKQEVESMISNYKSGTKLMIKAHCDAVGSDNYNNRLSDRRAASVQDYLMQNGIPSDAVVFKKGYGEKIPLNENLTAEERQLNRRVELVWINSKASTAVVENHIVPTTIIKDTVPFFSKQTIDSVKEGETLRLKNINFYGGRHIFLPQALAPLKELLEAMKANPKLEIEIQGHICCFPGADDGLDIDNNERKLSVNRAKAVFDFLVNNGIAENRMNDQGFAGRFPIVEMEITEADRTTNRRVEIKIIKK